MKNLLRRLTLAVAGRVPLIAEAFSEEYQDWSLAEYNQIFKDVEKAANHFEREFKYQRSADAEYLLLELSALMQIRLQPERWPDHMRFYIPLSAEPAAPIDFMFEGGEEFVTV